MTMTHMPIATVFGGSGFVGRYIVEALAHAGYRIRVAVRRPNEALFTMTYGTVGQVQTMQANIRDDRSTEAAIAGASVVVNCVGILLPNGKQQFDTVQNEGAERIARLAAEHGVERLVHISAIGANAKSDSAYAISKGKGEQAILEAFPTATILRPSIVFGPEDDFFNQFGTMAARFPALPVVGATTRFQPVYVGDVAKAALKAANGDVAPGIYELGGPDIETFRELMERVKRVTRRPRRLLLGIPGPVAVLMGLGSDLISKLSFGLIPPIMTRDQVRLLSVDNVVADDAQGFDAFGIAPRDMDSILDGYMWCYRPSGQYSDILESAKNLR